MAVKQDLIVIGGGAAGLSVASGAAQLGRKVTLIETADKLGGECLHYGCVPSKTLIHTAKVAQLIKQAGEVGLSAQHDAIDINAVNARVQQVIEQIQPHDDPERFRSYGCEVIFGQAKFIDAHTLKVGEQKIRGKRIVIASGSKPAVPPIKGLAELGYVTNETIFTMPKLPQRLLIMGAGIVGLEMAQAFVRLGVEVTVIGRRDRIAPQLDAEVAEQLRQILEAEGVQFHLSTQAKSVRAEAGYKLVECNAVDGGLITFECDEILVAIGRRPNVPELQLEQAGVKYSPKGIKVNAKMQTSRRHIYALGDVVDSPYRFTHVAEYQAGIVIANAIFRVPKKANYQVVPAVMFTDPEFASVGLTEAEAKQRYRKISVLRFDMKDIDRALAENQPHGMAKLIIHKKKIIGATILGPHAGEYLAEIVLAMQTNASIADISAAIHAYPTLSQINRRVVNTYYADKLFNRKTRALIKWINRLLP